MGNKRSAKDRPFKSERQPLQ